MPETNIISNETGNRAECFIYNAAIGAGAMARAYGLGAQIANTGVGFFFYSRMIAAVPIQNTFTQYVCANVAANMASGAVSATVAGVSLGAIANVAVAAITVVAVAGVLQSGYNTFVAKDEKEQVSISFRSFAAKTFFPVTRANLAAAPAA